VLPGGGRRYRMSEEVRENMIEGARISGGYDRDPNKALANYVDAHVQMALENYTDDSGSYLKRGDGQLVGRE